jgi:hypothetical protein
VSHAASELDDHGPIHAAVMPDALTLLPLADIVVIAVCRSPRRPRIGPGGLPDLLRPGARCSRQRILGGAIVDTGCSLPSGHEPPGAIRVAS